MALGKNMIEPNANQSELIRYLQMKESKVNRDGYDSGSVVNNLLMCCIQQQRQIEMLAVVLAKISPDEYYSAGLTFIQGLPDIEDDEEPEVVYVGLREDEDVAPAKLGVTAQYLLASIDLADQAGVYERVESALFHDVRSYELSIGQEIGTQVFLEFQHALALRNILVRSQPFSPGRLTTIILSRTPK